MPGNIFRAIVLFAVIAQIRPQYVDFFQSFSTFLQTPTTKRNEATRRPTTKSKYQDAIFFETDDYVKQKHNGGTLDPFTTTTAKPKRKKIKTTTRSWFLPDYNQNNNRRVDNGNNNSRDNNNGYNHGFVRPTARPVTKATTRSSYQNFNDRTTEYNQNNNGFYNGNNNNNGYNSPTERPISSFNVAQKPVNSRPFAERHTTQNPLLNRPGVRPAVVDTNRPPITNRPVTTHYDRPVTSPRPDEEPNIELGSDEDAMSETDKRRYYEIAEQKCDEYKALNTKKLVALPLANDQPSGVELNVSTCTPVNIPLIIGGKSVQITEFPHMSLVGWKFVQTSGYSWKCGGTLLSEQFVLTAGHCTYHDKDYNVISGPPQAVQLGSTYRDGQDATVISISTVIRHPKYQLNRSYNDVALIKMTTTVSFTKSISPACLGVPPPIGNRIIATGWGRTGSGTDESPDLRSVSIPVWSISECADVWGTSLRMPQGPSSASQLCAGERAGGKDTCQGDSGGPAQIQDGCTWRVVGVTSVGRSCGAVDTPALYAKIPRAFVASQIFADVKLNHNRNNNGGNQNNNNGYQNNNRDNQNNNSGNQNNNRGTHNGGINWNVDVTKFAETDRYNRNPNYNTENGDSSDDGSYRPGNHQPISNSGHVSSNNNRDEISRPGNHQTVNYNRKTSDINYFVTSQTSGNQNSDVRLGNHQILSNNNNNGKTGNNFFVTSHTTGNREDIRLGNHQTVTNGNRGNVGNNFFVTSHTSGNTEKSRIGNHQTVENNKNNNAGDNYFVTSQSKDNNRDAPRLGNHQRLNGNENNNDNQYNKNKFSDNVNSESNLDGAYEKPVLYENVYKDIGSTNDRNNYYYNNEPQNSQIGIERSDYGTTIISYNDNNNRYNGNHNRDYIVANRPWF